MSRYTPFFVDGVLIIALLLGLITFRALSGTGKIVVAQMCCAVLTEAAGLYIIMVLHKQNIWLYNTYILVEFLLLLAGGYLLQPRQSLKKWAIGMAVAYPIIWIINMSFVKGGFFVDKTFMTGCILLTSFYLWQLISLLRKGQQDYTTLLICYGILVYFCCSIPLFSFINYFLNIDWEISAKLYHIGHILNIIRYCIVGTGFLLLFRRQQSLNPR